MRIEIKNIGRIKDNDMKALYLLKKAMELSSEKMRVANIQFIASRYGIQTFKTQ